MRTIAELLRNLAFVKMLPKYRGNQTLKVTKTQWIESSLTMRFKEFCLFSVLIVLDIITTTSGLAADTRPDITSPLCLKNFDGNKL